MSLYKKIQNLFEVYEIYANAENGGNVYEIAKCSQDVNLARKFAEAEAEVRNFFISNPDAYPTIRMFFQFRTRSWRDYDTFFLFTGIGFREKDEKTYINTWNTPWGYDNFVEEREHLLNDWVQKGIITNEERIHVLKIGVHYEPVNFYDNLTTLVQKGIITSEQKDQVAAYNLDNKYIYTSSRGVDFSRVLQDLVGNKIITKVQMDRALMSGVGASVNPELAVTGFSEFIKTLPNSTKLSSQEKNLIHQVKASFLENLYNMFTGKGDAPTPPPAIDSKPE